MYLHVHTCVYVIKKICSLLNYGFVSFEIDKTCQNFISLDEHPFV